MESYSYGRGSEAHFEHDRPTPCGILNSLFIIINIIARLQCTESLKHQLFDSLACFFNFFSYYGISVMKVKKCEDRN